MTCRGRSGGWESGCGGVRQSSLGCGGGSGGRVEALWHKRRETKPKPKPRTNHGRWRLGGLGEAGAAAREEPPYYGALVAINKMPWARRSKDVDVGTLVGGYEGWLCMRVASSFPAGERATGRGLLGEREYRDDGTKGWGGEER